MAKPPSEKPAESDTRPTVLVVDDDRQLRSILARVLDARGWHVVTAGDGLSALQILDEYRFKAVISDLHLDGGPSGDKLLETARRLEPKARLLLLSGWITRDARARALAVDATLFEKPVELDELIEELERDRPPKTT